MARRLYKVFRPVISDAAKQLELTDIYDLYGFRHAFNSRLKEGGVPHEIRADLMGHEGQSETTSTYAEATELPRALETLKKLPVVTAHLQCRAVRLIPWVEQKRPPPFARPRKRKT